MKILEYATDPAENRRKNKRTWRIIAGAVFVFLLVRQTQALLNRPFLVNPRDVTASVVVFNSHQPNRVLRDGVVRDAGYLPDQLEYRIRPIGSDQAGVIAIRESGSVVGAKRYVVRVVGTKIQRLFEFPGDNRPVFRYGTVYLPQVTATEAKLLRYDLTGKKLATVPLPILQDGPVTYVTGPDVLSNGTCALSVSRGEGRSWRQTLYIVDKTGHLLRTIKDAGRPAFSHDGKWLAYRADLTYDVTVERLDGSERRSVPVWRPVKITDFLVPFLFPHPVGVSGVRWSEDDKWLLCPTMYPTFGEMLHATRVDPEHPGRCAWRLQTWDSWVSVSTTLADRFIASAGAQQEQR